MPPNYVLEGVVLSGQISMGQWVRIESPLSYLDARVAGVEIDRKIVPEGRQGQTVALMFAGIDFAEISDGLTENEDSPLIVVNALAIKNTPKLWWQFWI